MGDLLKTLAPTLASALLGPLGGVAVSALGKIIGVDNATVATVTEAFNDDKLTPEHLAEIKKLELQYQNDEKNAGSSTLIWSSKTGTRLGRCRFPRIRPHQLF